MVGLEINLGVGRLMLLLNINVNIIFFFCQCLLHYPDPSACIVEDSFNAAIVSFPLHMPKSFKSRYCQAFIHKIT